MEFISTIKDIANLINFKERCTSVFAETSAQVCYFILHTQIPLLP